MLVSYHAESRVKSLYWARALITFSSKEKNRAVDVELNYRSTKHVVKCGFGHMCNLLICDHDVAVVIVVLFLGASVKEG
jgi:hypothetical protein